jgi:hypothetical protein
MSAWGLFSSVFGRARRVPRAGFKQLTSKIGPRTFYKGKGCTPIGRHTRKGGWRHASSSTRLLRRPAAVGRRPWTRPAKLPAHAVCRRVHGARVEASAVCGP